MKFIYLLLTALIVWVVIIAITKMMYLMLGMEMPESWIGVVFFITVVFMAFAGVNAMTNDKDKHS